MFLVHQIVLCRGVVRGVVNCVQLNTLFCTEAVRKLVHTVQVISLLCDYVSNEKYNNMSMVVSLFCTKVSGRKVHLVQLISFILWTVVQSEQLIRLFCT